jgi:hypothetical protein
LIEAVCNLYVPYRNPKTTPEDKQITEEEQKQKEEEDKEYLKPNWDE